MTNPTSNYGWVLPNSADLVTDLPADFDVALQGVDTRLKALQPGTTLGDLAYSSATANTNTRLAIGTTGQVLSVSGGVPAWSTPSSGSLTQLATGTFSGSSVSLTSISGSYRDLRLVTTNLFFSLTQTNLMFQVNSTSGIYSTLFDGTGFNDLVSTSAETMRCSNTDTNTFGDFIFPNYAGNSFKVLLADYMGRAVSGGTPFYNLSRGIAGIRTTSAITSIQMTTSQGTFSGGTYTLYGVN